MKVIGEAQFGAVQHRGTAMASLIVSAFLDMCTLMGLSCFVLFVDLSKAFDYAIREVVMGWMHIMQGADDSVKRAFLESLGVPHAACDKLVGWINDTGGLLRENSADPLVCELVAALHSGSWFRMPGDEQYIVSIAGGTQGCKLGA